MHPIKGAHSIPDDITGCVDQKNGGSMISAVLGLQGSGI
jgi:hypothetical protein